MDPVAPRAHPLIMTFLSPGFLWLLLLAALPWIGVRRQGEYLMRALRSLALACCAIALAQPVVETDDDREHAVFVFDVSRSESLPQRTSAQIIDVARYLGPHAEKIGRRCAVVASDDVHYGLSRMGSAYCEEVGVETRVFRVMADALEWLSVGRTV